MPLPCSMLSSLNSPKLEPTSAKYGGPGRIESQFYASFDGLSLGMIFCIFCPSSKKSRSTPCCENRSTFFRTLPSASHFLLVSFSISSLWLTLTILPSWKAPSLTCPQCTHPAPLNTPYPSGRSVDLLTMPKNSPYSP